MVHQERNLTFVNHRRVFGDEPHAPRRIQETPRPTGLPSTAPIGTGRLRRILVGRITLNPGCHFLSTNSNAPGYSGGTPGDDTYAVAVTDTGGLQLQQVDGTIVDHQTAR